MNQYLLNLAVNAEERQLLARLDELARKASQGTAGRSDFLDLRQQVLAEAVAAQYGEIVWQIDGGFEGAERKRLLLGPAWENDDLDNQIQCLHIKSTDKMGSSPGHRDYLGAIMNLGLKREKFGDILVQEREAFVMADRSMSAYLCQQLERVGHSKVTTEVIAMKDLQLPEAAPQQITCTVSALRLDAVLAAACRISRAAAVELIEAGQVRLNHQVIEKNASLLEEADLLSVRGYGRIRVDEVEGVSKKGRLRIRLSKW
ncbi:MAG: RNA-binding protein [Firmicutes bacterium]|nr:RNA-binding protein [Bacillota bacterium]